jgi:hypothetical protein
MQIDTNINPVDASQLHIIHRTKIASVRATDERDQPQNHNKTFEKYSAF